MRTLVSFWAFLVLVALNAAADDPLAKKDDTSRKKADAPLKVGNDLPGPFHPYNVTGPHKQRFHSLISEHGLDPMVMIFYRGVDFGEPLPTLLKRLDEAIDKNPEARLAAFTVFLPDDLPDVLGSSEKDSDTNSKNDDARREVEKKIEQKGSDLKLNHVVLCLDTKADVKKYQLGDENLITVVLYSKLKIVAVYAMPKSEFTEATVEKIMTDAAEKFGAKRK